MTNWCGTNEDSENGLWGARLLLAHLSDRKTLKSTLKRQIINEEENVKSYANLDIHNSWDQVILLPLGVLSWKCPLFRSAHRPSKLRGQ